MTERDERKSFRCAVVDPGQECQLIVGANTLSARLLDQSAGGFAVLVNGFAGIEANQKAQLDTDAGRFVVRVVHVAEVAPPEDADTSGNEESPWFRLGLLRVGEVAGEGEPTVSLWADSLQFHMGQWCPGTGMLLIFGLLLALIVVGLSAAWVGGYFRVSTPRMPDRTTGKPTSQWKGDQPLPSRTAPQTEKTPSSSDESVPTHDRSDVDTGSPFGAQHGRDRESLPSGPVAQQWRETARRLPGAAAFALPEVVTELQLTADQQKRIQQIIDATFQTIQDLNKQLRGQQRQKISQRRAEVFDHARSEALGVLTAEQLAQWKKLAEGR